MRKENRNRIRIIISSSRYKSKSKSMGLLSSRSPILIGLFLVMFMGIAVYLRLWSIDSGFSQQESEMLRKQFDLANREAMEESAEWRLKYDEQVQRATQLLGGTGTGVKDALDQKTEEATSERNNLALLEKENLNLLARVELLTQELETVKLKCKTR
ncbi:hypothetical protein CKAN_02606400 [Cinnamomum micranthum f. kanehirae]|uniref:Uncharacterized protein n=1 Tax=Cinnamomum micranthum f. kanehirae TaxID=337451 RepID=A0A443Q0W4_9MAGN|nr:hypothetical protein CKAN_02606400 [Cinnamomum micranthum f. kanehirae]